MVITSSGNSNVKQLLLFALITLFSQMKIHFLKIIINSKSGKRNTKLEAGHFVSFPHMRLLGSFKTVLPLLVNSKMLVFLATVIATKLLVFKVITEL